MKSKQPSRGNFLTGLYIGGDVVNRQESLFSVVNSAVLASRCHARHDDGWGISLVS